MFKCSRFVLDALTRRAGLSDAEHVGRQASAWFEWLDTPQRERAASWADFGELDGVVWADWDQRGRLLVATAEGRLEVRALGGRAITVEVAHDLAPLTPDPAPAPEWARQW